MSLLKPGQIFAHRYVIQRKLAEGGMGAVFVALQSSTELEVAIKVLWPHVLEQQTAVKRFSLEARVSARIGSGHVVKVLDAGFDEETEMPFLVMELLEGATLQEVVERNGPRSPEETVEYIHQIALALDKAHTYVDKDGEHAPVIHRDLKPENIFLTRLDNGAPFIKVLDYGLAKILGSSTGLSRDLKGTPLYMASEQALGQPLSPATDIWPLGLIALFLLTGRPFWNAASNPDSGINHLISEIVALPLPSPSERLAEKGVSHSLPPAFDEWFARCVDRDPKKRFQTASAAATGLRRVLLERVAIDSSGEFDQTVAAGTSFPPPGSLDGGNASRSPSESENTSKLGGTLEPASVDEPLLVPHKRPSPIVVWGAALIALGAIGLGVWSSSRPSPLPPEDTPGSDETRNSGEETPAEVPRRIQIISYPRGAEVLVDGQFLCRSPCSVGAPHDAFELKLQLENHEPASRRVEPPYPTTLEMTLQPFEVKPTADATPPRPSPTPTTPPPSSDPRPPTRSDAPPPLLPQ